MMPPDFGEIGKMVGIGAPIAMAGVVFSLVYISLGYGLADVARHVMGCRLTQNALMTDDVAGIICLSLVL